MTRLPLPLVESLHNVKGFDKEAFLQIHTSGEQVTSVRINPWKADAAAAYLTANEKVPWSSFGYYLPVRPSFTFDPLFHAGLYYVQEASGMFLEQVLKQSTDVSKPLRVLDLCAAPGGKSTLLQSVISKDSLLVSNEVIKSRVHLLEENTSKWGGPNVVITNNDPKDFARLENYFDVIVIDAPCSGSGLFRRDPNLVVEWSENSVQMCHQRQQRIIADVWPALKQDGILIYSTCSYSKEEDEDIAGWMVEQFNARSIRIDTPPGSGIVETQSGEAEPYGYRFYPDKLKGEGFFIAALQKQDGYAWEGVKLKKGGPEKLSKTEEALVRPWLDATGDYMLFRQGEEVIALPSYFQPDIPVLQSALYIKQAGITAGKTTPRELLPHHHLALSTIINPQLVSIPLNKEQAVQYLRRDEVHVDTNYRGWALVNYEGHALGWVKVLPNRLNNYYPKEWRILKAP